MERDQLTVSSGALAGRQMTGKEAGEAITPLFNYISGVWTSFGGKRSAAEMRQMQLSWFNGLRGLTEKECIAAIDRKVQQGQIYPPGSPAELRVWVEEIKKSAMPPETVSKQATQIIEEYGHSPDDYDLLFSLAGICTLYKWDIPASVAAVRAEIERRKYAGTRNRPRQ